jgi:hypothetical protein
MPSCFQVYTLNSTPNALDHWNSAVAQWQAAHANQGSDVAKPIVSVFSPGLSGESTTLTGLRTLVATAVDDRAMHHVQFHLSGTNFNGDIGAQVTQDGASGDAQSTNGFAGPTKYRLVSWDSYIAPNGTYQLTAVAQDSASPAHTTTSQGVSVTVSNPPLAPPTNCQMVRQGPPPPAQTVYLKVTWSNGAPTASTQVTIIRGGITVLQTTVTPGTTSYFYPPNGQGGQYWAQVRHVRGASSSASCTSNSVTISK